MSQLQRFCVSDMNARRRAAMSVARCLVSNYAKGDKWVSIPTSENPESWAAVTRGAVRVVILRSEATKDLLCLE